MNRSPSTTAQDLELASELLDVTNEDELDAFLGRLVRDTAPAGGRMARADERALVASVKRTAEQTVPTLARVAGTDVDATPPVAAAARAFGLEVEGLSAEDRDFEIARQFVRFVQTATRTAVDRRTPPDSGRWVRHGNAIVLIGLSPDDPTERRRDH